MNATRRTIRMFGPALLLAALGIATGPGSAQAQGTVLVPETIAPPGYGFAYGVGPYGGWGGGFGDVGFYGGGFPVYGGGFPVYGGGFPAYGGGFYGPGFYGANGAAPTYQPYQRPQGRAGYNSFGVPQLNIPQFANPAGPAIRPQVLNGLPALNATP